MAESESNGVRDDLPRISLESIQDWRRIKENINSAALVTLESKLAERGLTNQRHILLPHLKQFVDRTFQIAKPNLRINGRNFDEYNEDEQDMDQYDESLDRRVWSLSDQRLKWDLEIALKRRGVPLEVEALMRDLIAQQREHDDKEPEIKETDVEVDDEALEDLSTVNPELSQFVADLQAKLPEQLERVRRVQEVDQEIRNLRT